MTADIYEDLLWRGLIAQTTNAQELATALKAPLTFYVGTDPTGASLHAGHLVQYLTVRRLQQSGHHPIIVAGGATGHIGDPRDVGERTLLSEDTLSQWNTKLKDQITALLSTPNADVLIVDNMDWTKELTAIDFLRDIGKHFSINTMISRELVKRRLENDGISFTEFSYPLLQGNDYLQLYKKYQCSLQIGGSDQWGNIISGVDLIRRVTGATVHALTTPLVTDTEGRKIGKSTGGGGIWLDPAMTSPYAWYQYFYNIADADVPNYLRWFSFKSRTEIEQLIADSAAYPHLRIGQLALAQELTDLIHGPDYTQLIGQATRALFGQSSVYDLDADTLSSALSQAPHAEIDNPHLTIVDLLLTSGLVASKGEAKRTIKEGGAYVNNNKISQEDWTTTAQDWLAGGWLVIRKGKKNFAGVRYAHASRAD